jgi:hypothetical protein
MSLPIVRRLTAALAILAILCLATPASAATRPHSTKVPVVLGSGLFDQILSWLGGLWLGQASSSPSPATSEKAGVTMGTTDTFSASSMENVDRGAQIDPNGGS